MLESKLKVAVDYENATLTDAIREAVLPFLNVPLSSGGKKNHTFCPIPFRASVRSAGHVSIPAL
jgi:hypothetical protein